MILNKRDLYLDLCQVINLLFQIQNSISVLHTLLKAGASNVVTKKLKFKSRVQFRKQDYIVCV